MTVTINAEEHIQLWNAAAIKVIDVRHFSMMHGEELRSYLFPSSVFLYAIRGEAQVLLDGIEHSAKRFHLWHGGKGTCLDIFPTEAEFEYYLIFYKATIPSTGRREILHLIERYNPFQLQYSLAPLYAAVLFDKVDTMLKEWQSSRTLEKFHVKTLFYQFVYELLWQLEHQQIGMKRPDLAAQVVRYIQEHYHEPVTRESIAQIFHYSVPYVSRQFRQETGISMIDYVIKERVNKAMEYLQKTDMTVQEASASVGYDDVSYFTRIFKKHTGMTPKQFKDQDKAKKAGFDYPIIRVGSSLFPRRLQRYIGSGYENHYRYKREGDLSMYRHKSSMGVTLLLCLTLLLSACSGTGSSNNGSVASSAPAATTDGSTQVQASASNSGAASAAEMVTYSAVNGEVKIPKNPQRVVIIAGAFVGHLLALGIKPVGAGEEAFNSYTEGKLDGVESIGDGIAYEKILELQPDLIIVWNDPAVLDKLNQIAPTVVVDYGVPVRQQLLEFGKMTGREEQANAWITAWDKKIADYKPKVQAAVGDKTVAIFDSGSAKEFYAYGNKLGRGGEIIYGEFELKAPPIIQKEAIDSGTGWAKLSLELLPEYAGDYIFISEWTGKDNPEAVFEGSMWEQLEAVKNNHVFREKGRGFMFSDPVSLDAQLEFVVKSFIGK
ncbi:AraC family transcriptional regulator [Paenibacillus sp. FSL H8-0537]|uniref:AraC family transcriptional regulator n=1 Tax=Paenibacillus sp. FSL H8-0537 TaxID=2921399 RepID=UPI0031017106